MLLKMLTSCVLTITCYLIWTHPQVSKALLIYLLYIEQNTRHPLHTMTLNPTNIIIQIIISTLWRKACGSDILRTVGGRDAEIGEYPYVVRIELQYTDFVRTDHRKVQLLRFIHLCTASVLSPRASLTAGHCCLPTASFKLTINENYQVNIKTVIRHGSTPGRPQLLYPLERFSDVLDCTQLPSGRDVFHPLIADGLAILRTEPILLREYGKVSVLDYRLLYGQRIALLGYGITVYKNNWVGTTLDLLLPLQVLDGVLTNCDDTFSDFPSHLLSGTNYPSVCASHPCEKPGSVCPGDSGGPVVHATGIVGVISKTAPPSCYNLRGEPGVTRIQGIISPLSSNVDWIAETIKKTNVVH